MNYCTLQCIMLRTRAYRLDQSLHCRLTYVNLISSEIQNLIKSKVQTGYRIAQCVAVKCCSVCYITIVGFFSSPDYQCLNNVEKVAGG